MYKKILVPLDGSKRAETILPHVEELALNFKAQVVFLHVIEPHYVFTSPHGFNMYNIEEISHEANTKQAKTYLAGLAGEFREKGIKAKTYVEDGPVSHTILNIAEREEADLIAMASHGRTGLSQVFYGSVAASLLHSVDRPLLLIRADGN
jgi:nucleotide-binding universal stress UspA family protein